MAVETQTTLKVATEVWIATAILHREHPEQSDFAVKTILERIEVEHLADYRRGLQPNVSSHCVAQKKPDPGNYRFLTDTGRGRRRLFRGGDPFHPNRKSGPITPREDDLPTKYRDLLRWYREEYDQRAPKTSGRPQDYGTTRALLRFVGLIPADDVKRMERAIEEQCERIDAEQS